MEKEENTTNEREEGRNKQTNEQEFRGNYRNRIKAKAGKLFERRRCFFFFCFLFLLWPFYPQDSFSYSSSNISKAYVQYFCLFLL
jgi:hypothetical protein